MKKKQKKAYVALSPLECFDLQSETDHSPSDDKEAQNAKIMTDSDSISATRFPSSPISYYFGSFDSNLVLVVLVSSAGNILEWFDFAIFGYFADVFGELFFPGGDKIATMAKTFAVFAGAFIMRPIGGAMFGYIGDKYGRKRSILLSIFLMAFSSFATGCLPTYDQVRAGALFYYHLDYSK